MKTPTERNIMRPIKWLVKLLIIAYLAILAMVLVLAGFTALIANILT